MKKIMVLGILLLIAPISTSAYLDYPYPVDEKPQVLFGDSELIDGYQGLENYTHDYKNGYAHFTFTYSHDRCCTAAYPPVVHVTNIDPRTTSGSGLIKRSSSPAFVIPSKFSDPNIETGWYLYDIQFDSGGYNVKVNLRATSTEIFNGYMPVADLAESDWIALMNYYPTFGNIHSMAFAPVLVKDPVPEKPDPVIIIPGIMGSAKKNGQLVIDPILHTYDDLITTLEANGYTKGTDLFTFPYEWRDSNVFSANLLDQKISEVKQTCGCSKVDLVAHSMGGLVARAYIQSVDYDQDVDQLIFLGTPHKGAPTDYLQWEAGKFSPDFNSDLRGLFFQAEAIKNGYPTIFDYIHDRPIVSVQELLPTFDYLIDDDTDATRSYPNNYPANPFLENLNNNIGILVNSGVKITNFVGNSGENKTIEKIRVVPTTHARFWQHGEPDGFDSAIGDNGLERGEGDNTVTTYGATLFTSTQNINSNASHNRIPTVEANKIFNLLTNKTSLTNIDTGSNIDPKILLLQLLSPIDVVITAPDGKKVGKNFATNQEYNEIPNAFYSGFNNGDEEYVTIPNPLDGKYRVEVQGTGNGGKYGILTSYISDTFSTTTETTGITKPNQITELNVSINNTDPSDLETERKITLDILINDINGAYDLGWIKDKKTRDSLITQAKLIIKFEKKKNGKYEQKIDKILIKLLKIELDQLLKKNKITKEAYNLVKKDLEYLINNN